MIHRYVQRDRARRLSEETLCSIIKKPVVTEKTTQCRENNQYVFLVQKWADKIMIKSAVEAVFGIKVQSVNTLCRKGKSRKFRGFSGVRSDTKRAFVTLSPGQNFDLETGSVL